MIGNDIDVEAYLTCVNQSQVKWSDKREKETFNEK